MKYALMVVVTLSVCASVFGEVSEDRLKELRRIMEIESVRDYEEGGAKDTIIALRAEFSSKDTGLKNIYARFAVEVTDKKTKQVYFVERTGVIKRTTVGDYDYEGEGYWTLSIPYGDFERLKVTAYAVEFGVMDGKTFVPFTGEYDDVDSYEELKKRDSKPYPSECRLVMTTYVR